MLWEFHVLQRGGVYLPNLSKVDASDNSLPESLLQVLEADEEISPFLLQIFIM